jgi:hypothetical protein
MAGSRVRVREKVKEILKVPGVLETARTASDTQVVQSEVDGTVSVIGVKVGSSEVINFVKGEDHRGVDCAFQHIQKGQEIEGVRVVELGKIHSM